MVKGFLGDLAIAVVLEEIKDYLTIFLPEFLRGIGTERLKRLIASNVTLWDIWEEREKILEALEEYKDFAARVDLIELDDLIREVLGEKCPEFRFLPQYWVIGTLRQVRNEL